MRQENTPQGCSMTYALLLGYARPGFPSRWDMPVLEDCQCINPTPNVFERTNIARRIREHPRARIGVVEDGFEEIRAVGRVEVQQKRKYGVHAFDGIDPPDRVIRAEQSSSTRRLSGTHVEAPVSCINIMMSVSDPSCPTVISMPAIACRAANETRSA